MYERITIKQALRRGFFCINGPVMLIMFMPFGIAYGVHNLLPYLRPFLASDIIGFIDAICVTLSFLGFPAGWLWWSVSVPKWKLWAYSRVDNLLALKRAAVRAGLIWPDGSLFAKTEICSREVRKQIQALEDAARPMADDDEI